MLGEKTLYGPFFMGLTAASNFRVNFCTKYATITKALLSI